MWPKCSPQRGFTLIELLVVMVVIVAITSAVVAGVGNIRGASVQSETGKLAVAVRYLYNLAVLSGHNHRLVIDLDTQTYWGEEQNSSDPCETFLLPGEDEDLAPKKPKKGKKGEVVQEDNDKTGGKAGFQETTSKLLSKYTLDKGLIFYGVMTSHQATMSDKGQAYVYFFPNGTTENALIYIAGDKDKDTDDVMTIEVKALQGTAKVHKDKVDVASFGRIEG